MISSALSKLKKKRRKVPSKDDREDSVSISKDKELDRSTKEFDSSSSIDSNNNRVPPHTPFREIDLKLPKWKTPESVGSFENAWGPNRGSLETHSSKIYNDSFKKSVQRGCTPTMSSRTMTYAIGSAQE